MRTRGISAHFVGGVYPHLGSVDNAVGSGTLYVAYTNHTNSHSSCQARRNLQWD